MKREPAKTFQDLIVWQKAHQFVLSVYQSSENLPQKYQPTLLKDLKNLANLINVVL